jgi:phosphoglucosamine mutase
MCDEKSKIIDGDQIIAMIAKRWKRKKILKGGVVGTLMSNYGLEKFFLNEKIRFKRSQVGDRYVKELMKKNNFNLGGEQSGHIILGKFATTGDGLLVASETLFALRKGKIASKLFQVYKSVPQKLLNINVRDKRVVNSTKCKKAIKLVNRLIKNKGRFLLRPSGTEPKVRIMCETFNRQLMNKCINIVKKTIH